jgi:hypothetical protein
MESGGGERRGHRSGGDEMRFLVTRVFGLVAAAAIVVPLIVTGCSSSPSSSTPPKPSATQNAHKTRLPSTNCKSSGCAVVTTARNLPPVTAFYGASCAGIHGSWFFNATEGGGTALKPAYALAWSFGGGATSAKPSARSIYVPRTKTTTVTMTLNNGQLKLTGVRKPNTTVAATGSLVVRLVGSPSSPSLIFVEKGLLHAEHRLGLVSPFNPGGHPLVVPIKHVSSLVGC